jgi:hypothetical protein
MTTTLKWRDEPFDFLLVAPARIDYLLQLDAVPAPQAPVNIRQEVRCPGGRGVYIALALAAWGARVTLLCNAIPDDPNGRFFKRELATVPNLSLWLSDAPDAETPYCVQLHSGVAPLHLVRQAPIRSTFSLPTLPSARLQMFDSELADLSTLHMDSRVAGVLHPDTVFEVPGTAPRCVWWRGENEAGTALREHAGRWDCDVWQIAADGGGACYRRDGQVERWGQVGREVPVVQEILGVVGVPEVFWAGVLWGELQGWDWPGKFLFARTAARLKRQRIGSVGMMPDGDEVTAAMARC